MSALAVKEIKKINVAFPEAENLHLTVAVGGCRLIIKPGNGSEWVSGTYNDPGGVLPYNVSRFGGTVRISQAVEPAEIFGFMRFHRRSTQFGQGQILRTDD